MASNSIYDKASWELDGSFSADAGQEISEEVYNDMLNCMPPLTLPNGKAEQALQDYDIPVHSGFLMGEPHSHDKGGALFLAFGMNDYGKGKRYYYLGLSHAAPEIGDGFYYLFDCMGLLFSENITGLPDNVINADYFKDDKEAINYAADHEAELYKYEYRGGRRVSKVTLYDPYGCFDKKGGK